MASEVAALEAEVKEFKLQLDTVQSSLQVDPDNAELQSLKAELEEFINLTEASIAELKPATPTPAPSKSSQQAIKEKWSKESHPASQSGYRKLADSAPPEETPTPTLASFSVNDTVQARWKSGDGAWYPARITSITGSSSNPVYIVSFKSYGTTETLNARDIRPSSNSADSRKRKADETPGISSSSTFQAAPQNASIISAAADINPTLASQARNDPGKVGDGPARPNKVSRKVKANKELEAGKSKWQDFTSKSKYGKGPKKESMFRTPEGVNARVGFTGSGQAMRKDPTRSRHIYQQGDEEGY